MGALIYAAAETLTAFVHLATIATLLGAFASIYSQSLLAGFLAAMAALIAGAVGFGYSIWRNNRAQAQPTASD